MKISKSLKVYIHILLTIFVANNLYANTELSNYLVIYDKPKTTENIKFKDFNLQEVDLSKNKGKIVILNFWATWCAPCKKEMPSLDKLSGDYTNLLVYPINMEKPNEKKTLKFFKELNIKNLQIYYDPEFKLAKQFKMIGLPTTILINKQGDEFGRVIGEIDFNDKDFINVLKEYF